MFDFSWKIENKIKYYTICFSCRFEAFNTCWDVFHRYFHGYQVLNMISNVHLFFPLDSVKSQHSVLS